LACIKCEHIKEVKMSTDSFTLLSFVCLLSSFGSCQQDDSSFAILSKFTFVKNGVYSGDTRAGIPHGDGLIVYYVDDDEKRYNFTGVFDQGKPRGDSGTLHYRSGDVYQGGFSEEQLPQGKGTLRQTNGNIFTGFFKNGKPDGQGTLSYADGSRREGTWSSGELDGFVFYYEGDRLVRAERWFRGKKLSDKQTPTTESTTEVTSATPAPVSPRFPAEFARSPTRSEDVDRLSFKVSPAELDQIMSEAVESSRTAFARYLKTRFEMVHPTS